MGEIETLFTPVTRGLVRDKAYVQIREAIFAGKFWPGTRLRELTLARAFGVSQATIREALALLEKDNLVTRTPGRGTQVIDLSARAISERITVRVALEQIACVSAAEKMTPADFEEAAGRAQEIRRAGRLNDFYALFQADLNFHRYIWQKSGNEALSQVLEPLVAPLFALGVIYARAEMKRAQDASSHGSHEVILASMKQRNRRQIRVLVRRHWTQSGLQRIIAEKEREPRKAPSRVRA